jgi:hypothetical protein
MLHVSSLICMPSLKPYLARVVQYFAMGIIQDNWRTAMESIANKRRAIGNLVILGAILVVIATWFPGGKE